MKLDFDCIVIGAGVAGMTSAIYLKRANIDVLLLEKAIPGGQIINTLKIENYPGFESIDGPTLASNIYNQVDSLGIDYRYGNVLEITKEKSLFIVKTDSNTYKTKKIIIATGRNPRKLNIENEDKLIGRGISYCATCDGMFFKEKDVAVIGGGNTALEESLYLSDICNKVTIINRSNKLRADDILVEKIKYKENIDILYNSVIDTLIIDKEQLKGIKLNNGVLNIDGLFVFIGQVPSNDVINKLNIKTEDGYIKVNKNMETSIKGIYACGDIVKKDFYQISTAIGEGTIAALNVKKSLKKLDKI